MTCAGVGTAVAVASTGAVVLLLNSFMDQSPVWIREKYCVESAIWIGSYSYVSEHLEFVTPSGHESRGEIDVDLGSLDQLFYLDVLVWLMRHLVCARAADHHGHIEAGAEMRAVGSVSDAADFRVLPTHGADRGNGGFDKFMPAFGFKRGDILIDLDLDAQIWMDLLCRSSARWRTASTSSAWSCKGTVRMSISISQRSGTTFILFPPEMTLTLSDGVPRRGLSSKGKG